MELAPGPWRRGRAWGPRTVARPAGCVEARTSRVLECWCQRRLRWRGMGSLVGLPRPLLVCVHAGETTEVPAQLPADRANDLFSGEVWLWEGAALGLRICCHSRSAESCPGGAREQMPFGKTSNTVTTRLGTFSGTWGSMVDRWKCRRASVPAHKHHTVPSCPLFMEGADPREVLLLLDYPQLQGPH